MINNTNPIPTTDKEPDMINNTNPIPTTDKDPEMTTQETSANLTRAIQILADMESPATAITKGTLALADINAEGTRELATKLDGFLSALSDTIRDVTTAKEILDLLVLLDGIDRRRNHN